MQTIDETNADWRFVGGGEWQNRSDEWFMNGKRIDLETMEPMED